MYLDDESGIFSRDTVEALRLFVEEYIEREKAKGDWQR